MNTNKQPDIKIPSKQRKYFSKKKDFLMLGLGIVSVLYLLNFSFGFIEFLPDALPLVGNLDEVAMTGFLILTLEYFNLGFIKTFIKKRK